MVNFNSIITFRLNKRLKLTKEYKPKENDYIIIHNNKIIKYLFYDN